MKRNMIAAVALAAVIGAGATTAIAHGGATGVVKERMEAMEALGDAMKELTAMMRGQQDYSPDRVRTLAGTIDSHSGAAMTKLFPKDSLDHPSEALPAIWSDWDRFSALSAQLSTYAQALAAAADNHRPAGSAPGGMMGQGTMQGQGMMHGQGMMGGGMMGGGQGPTAEMLAQMPPDGVFFHLADTCSACHQSFRKKQN
ncbi:cytochrome c [Thalassobaculum sp. OXR-137]|uniref:c-type cytochrome n=1 Tax=Thalassobaculum sp. OXR-137 TaxID=3100173 RepID=UPI002AC90362|nr:cytochrome c [Thalassobaculum sp. OXR-137]WPZ34560.1 cytochrome c [Thalassobaculum sp. OXR-137]